MFGALVVLVLIVLVVGLVAGVWAIGKRVGQEARAIRPPRAGKSKL